jgi:hypothetical protein
VKGDAVNESPSTKVVKPKGKHPIEEEKEAPPEVSVSKTQSNMVEPIPTNNEVMTQRTIRKQSNHMSTTGQVNI